MNNIDLDADLSAKTNARSAELDEQRVRKQAQLHGIEFQGVMCSAARDDQDGLDTVQGQFFQFVMMRDVILPAKINAATGSEKSALQLQRDVMAFPTINFRFENGTILPLNEGNIEALSSVWMPFRLSFFPPESE